MKRLFFLLLLLFCGIALHAQKLVDIVYKDKNNEYKGLGSWASQKKTAAVLILPAWKGIDNEAKSAAEALIKEGYQVMIADIYGKDNVPKDNNEASKFSSYFKNNYKAYQYRIHLALQKLIQRGGDANKIAVIGYCFGGTGALEVARSIMPVSGVVCIHGSLNKASDRPNRIIQTKVLVQHPAEDKSVSKADYDNLEKELKDGKADYQIITYAKSGHTFTNPESKDYNEKMAKRAWDHLLLFLNETLKN